VGHRPGAGQASRLAPAELDAAPLAGLGSLRAILHERRLD
jgi:hypothetical protein